jgi:SRSO17 transposase
MDGLAKAAGHEDRQTPLKNYCKGLLLPGERKSIEPMAARLDPAHVEPMRQSLHHLVAKAPWSDEALLEEVRNQVMPAMEKDGPVVAWIVDDTGFPKKGKHSVGVTRQYCGQVGKQENCRVAVSLSVATWSLSLPIAYRLYLPKEWTDDKGAAERRKFPRRSNSKPSRKSLWSRSAQRQQQRWRPGLFWLTLPTASTQSFAQESPNLASSMLWACKVR